MNDFGCIFTEEQYLQLQEEYKKKLSTPQTFINQLQSITTSLQHTSFQMPLRLQNQILRNLSIVQQILSIVYVGKSPKSTTIPNTPFDLIYYLTQLSLDLTSHAFKSPYQILLLKANTFTLQSIKEICEYFSSKSLKPTKFRRF